MAIPSQVYMPEGLCGEWVCVLWKHHGAPPRPEHRSRRTVARKANVCPSTHGYYSCLFYPCVPHIGLSVFLLSSSENVYEWPLSSLGPFTVFVPTNRGLKGINIKELLNNNLKAQYFVKLHVIAGQLNTTSLNNTDIIYTLTGKSGEISRGEKDNQLRIRIQGGRRKGKLLQGNIIASNGILHIVDKAMDSMEPKFESKKEKTGLGMDLQQENRPYTVFVPSNDALSNMKAEDLDYLLSAEGSLKLLELVRYHTVSNAELEIASLISIGHIRSMAKQFLYFNTTSTGQVLVSGEEMEETDIVAKNGRIFTLAGVLIPPTIVPILPHRCDVTKSHTAMGVCESCFSHALSPCPPDSKPIPFSKRTCVIEGPAFPKTGCTRYCKITIKVNSYNSLRNQGVAKASSAPTAVHAQEVSPNPAQEMDRIDVFYHCGTACCVLFLVECLCIHGKCDNRIDSDGICLPGSCRNGYTGKFCDKAVVPCEPSLQLCHEHADCQLSDGAVSCVCKSGYEGDGMTCSKVDPCASLNSGGCNIHATCQLEPSYGWECVCPKGYEGDGRICYGNAADVRKMKVSAVRAIGSNRTCLLALSAILAYTIIYLCSKNCGRIKAELQELSTLPEATTFNQWVNDAQLNSVLSTTSNLTVLVPSLQAIENMDEDEKDFWMSKGNIPTLLKYHLLTGAYSFADFQNLSSSDMLPTSLQSNFLHLSKENGNLTVEGAHIVTGDIASTNGIIHVIDKVLTPLRSTIMPRLLARLEQMPDYSIFRGYIIQYGLANEIEAANTYTVFAPNNDAIENYLRGKKVATLLFVNDAPISDANVATDKGIIHGLGKVLEIQKNRCDTNHTVITAGETKYCIFTENSMRLYTIQIGCQPKCAKTIITRECCAGYFGQQCQPCPGKAGSACFGNGICLDGINGSGICQCGAGFVGTACESCAEGKYGRNCDQVCACVHGKCSSGIDGDGSCECNVGWRGVTCESEIKDDACNNTCHTSAKAFPLTVRAYWFNLDCHHCSAIDACETSNGGCSANAECRKTTPGNRVCVCKAGYTGDGVVCLEINPCLENNGGCDKNAECTQTGPNQVSTFEFAICKDTELTERTCTCKPNYIGDGFKCRGNIHQELLRNSNTSRFYFHLEALSIRDIAGPGPFTVFVPHKNVLNNDQRVRGWLAKGVLAQILRYHMVGCASLLHSDLTTLTNVTSLHGDPIQISYVQESLEMVAAKHGYVLFSNLLEKNKLLGLIHDPIHKPVTLFWPTDAAIRRLPQEQQDFLFKKSNTDKLVQYLKFHIIRNAEILAYQLPRSTLLKTLQGSNLSISCGDNKEAGTLFLNDRQCKIVQRQLEFDGGIAYGIDCLLMDPSLGGRCDSFFTVDIMGYCASCFSGAKCPPGTKPKVIH
ncbi:hypothetical protein CIB84_000535 [Bambusicola thoracicus]|uniref:Stabilin-2 n=1 Tax=Bambusicola thoracicus TaxID=9083 RepID=A0A2P4TH65_BAMTH|nr:hypothetical protein CIB84_000535 [Bambusicola thoracicus]